MATVSGTLKLNDRMSGVLRNITKAMSSTLRAMEQTDVASSAAFRSAKRDAAIAADAVEDFANELGKIPPQQDKVKNGFGGWRAAIVTADAALRLMEKGISKLKAGMDISDQLTQTSARLGIINDNLQTQNELEKMIMQSANRARSSYFDTADAVGQLGMNAADAFSSTKEIVAFSELLNKSFKVSGADAQAQAGAVRQLTQAMASGVLRGDEFNSIAEQAPMIYDAIAKYMGKSKGEIRALAADGAITADIVRNAMFAAAGDIEDKFAAMPKTWSDNWTLMKNTALTAFQPVLRKLNELANSERFQEFMSSGIATFTTLANIASWALDGMATGVGWVADNFDLLLLGLAVLGIAYLILERKAVAAGIKTAGAWLMANWPILAVIAAIGIAIAVLSHFGISVEDIMGAVGGAIFWVGSLFKNLGLGAANVGLGIANVFMALVGNIITAFTNAGLNIKSFFLNLTSTVLGFVASIAEALSKLPFVEFDYAGLAGKADEYAQAAAAAQDAKGEYQSIGDAWSEGFSTFEAFEKGWGSDAFANGQNWTKGLTNSIGDLASGIDNLGAGSLDYSEFGGVGGNTIDNIDKVGSVGKIDDEVSLSEEDIKLLRDVAANEYQLHYTQLTPQLSATFGDIRETADIDEVYDRFVQRGLEELQSSLVLQG